MSDSVFFDTNILVYSYSNSETEKQTIARRLITDNNSCISTQVLNELANTITRKFKFTYQDAIISIKESCQNNKLHINTDTTIFQACKIAELYGFSFYDSLIIAAAIESNCVVLYSEDMNNGQIIDNKLTIVNPFVDKM
jgi:predicted nucleic acid-binding protein